MSSLFLQQYPTADSFTRFSQPSHPSHPSHPNAHIYSAKHSIVQQFAAPGSYSMENLSAAEEAALYQMALMKEDSDPRLSMPDAGVPYDFPIYSAPRRPNASVEHWLTSESPVARATNFDAPQPQNPYRLPSLPGTTFLPESLDYNVDAKYDIARMEGIAMPDMPYEHSSHHLHMSEVDNVPRNMSPPTTWNTQDEYYSNSSPTTPIYSRRDFMSARGIGPPASSYSSPGFIDDSPMYSPCSSAPDIYRPASTEGRPDAYSGRYAAGLQIQIPRSFPNDGGDQEDEEEIVGGKPYAQLIQECLLQAPGHRMMLRDIYDWFERNTIKPRESGGNGWQNSIRHNLSMNKAFENDKTTITNARGEPKKATSVWYLTNHALHHGVQSTTRYRKNNTGRKSAYNRDRDVDWKRQSSGSRGGKASRKATQMRRLGAGVWSTHPLAEEPGPFDHLLHAANMMSDYPGTRGSSPMSPSENYPCTPRSPVHQDYPTSVPGGFGCHGGDLSYHDMQLQDAIYQAGYGSNAEVMW